MIRPRALLQRVSRKPSIVTSRDSHAHTGDRWGTLSRFRVNKVDRTPMMNAGCSRAVKGCGMSVEETLDKLAFQLRHITGVADVQVQRGDHEVEVGVVLAEYDWDVREFALETVDDFAREHLDEVSVEVHFIDAVSADRPLCTS